MYDGVGVGDGLDDLDGTPQEAEEHWKRYKAQLRAFNAKHASRQGSVVETASGENSDAPFGGGKGDLSLCYSNGGGSSSGSDSANNVMGRGNESTPTSPSSRDGGEGTGGVGKASQRLRLPHHPTLHPRQIAERELPSRYLPGGTGTTWRG